MPVEHAAAMVVDELAHGHTGRRLDDARFLDAPRHRPRPRAGMALTPLLREPLGTLLEDVANPPERLDVLVQRGPAEDADFRNVRRPIARQAALAFDALDHRALFAADVRARAAAQLDEAGGSDAGGLERRDLAAQDLEHRGVLVAHIEIDALRLDGVRRDQRAFERAMRVALEKPAVLERAGLALVAVDRHEART